MTAREQDPQGVSLPGAAARLEAIRERLAKATQGPWVAGGGTDVRLSCLAPTESHKAKGYQGRIALVMECDADAAFLAHAWEDIAWLLARLAPATPSGAAIAEHSPDDANTREERTR